MLLRLHRYCIIDIYFPHISSFRSLVRRRYCTLLKKNNFSLARLYSNMNIFAATFRHISHRALIHRACVYVQCACTVSKRFREGEERGRERVDTFNSKCKLFRNIYSHIIQLVLGLESGQMLCSLHTHTRAHTHTR